MNKRFSIATYVILGLALIGIASRAFELIIPIFVFGIIFLLYKYPPSKWGKGQAARRNRNNSGSSKTKDKRTRNASFRVIDGNKGSSEEPPKYH